MPIDIPDIRQRGEADCGRACVNAYCDFLGVSRPVVSVDLWLGVAPIAVVAALRAAKLNVIHGVLTLEMLKAFLKMGHPVITLIQSEGVGHYVIVTGVTARNVHYHDPASGPAKCPIDRWPDIWTDTDFLGSPYNRFGIIAHASR